MHHLHCKDCNIVHVCNIILIICLYQIYLFLYVFHLFISIFPRLVILFLLIFRKAFLLLDLMQLLKLCLAQPYHSFHLAKTSSTYVIANQELIDELIVTILSQFDLICEVHRRLEELLIGHIHARVWSYLHGILKVWSLDLRSSIFHHFKYCLQ